MIAGVVPNLNSAFRFGVQKALRGKSGQAHYFIEHLPLKKNQKFDVYNRGIDNCCSHYSGIGALSGAHTITSGIVLGSSSGYYNRHMAASGSVAASGDLVVDSLISSCGNVSSIGKSSGVYFSNRDRYICQKASVSLRNGEAKNRSIFCGYFVYDLTPKSGNLNSLVGSLFKSYSTSTCYSNGDATHVSVDGSSSDEKIASVATSDEKKSSGVRALKLLSGSCYLPHPDKEVTGGEDAHFICADEQVVGVADGVGGWADVGVNAGEYSRQLMSNSVKAIQDEPKGLIDPARVLEKAYTGTNAKGSSTACIIVLNDQGLHAINLGDSGFIVVRDGCTIFESPVQQHGFNFTFQLESGNRSDLPSSGQVFTIPALPGDVIVAGTDGLFDNLYNHEINALVVNAVSSGFSPEVTAQKIAALARQRALDRRRQTPFSAAAQEAGYTYYGGKLDDITVVVSFITNTSGT